MMGNLTTWLNGVIGGAIGGAANCITMIIVDPDKFSPGTDGGVKHLLIVALVSGIVGAALYLKNHPTPWDGATDRRNGNAGNAAPLADRRAAVAAGVAPPSAVPEDKKPGSGD